MIAVLAFIRSNWQLIVIGCLVVALHLANEGRKDAVNDLRTFKAEAAQAVAEHKAKDAEGALADRDFQDQQEKSHASQMAVLTTSLDGVAVQLRNAQKGNGGSGALAKPVRDIAICGNNADANGRLSSALQKTLGDIDAVVGRTAAGIIENQIGIGQSIVAPAAIKQLEAAELREFAIRGNKVNAVPTP